MLAEILFVALVLVIGILGVWALFRQGNIEFYKTENNLKAYNLAVEGLEWLCSLSFDELIKLPNGQIINGMRIAVDSQPDPSWAQLASFPIIDAFWDDAGELVYPLEYGGADTPGEGSWRDFSRWAIVEPVDSSSLSDCTLLNLSVFIQWIEQGKKGSSDAQMVEKFTRTESLSTLLGRTSTL